MRPARPRSAATPARRTALRRTAFAAGALYLITFLTSVPTLALYRPVLAHDDFVLGSGSTTSVLAGTTLEVLLAVSCVGTAAVLFPVVRRRSETAAVGYLAARLIEAGLILVGVTSLLSIITLRQDPRVGARAPWSPPDRLLVAVYNRAFLLSQSLMPAFSALCLGSALYRAHLVPRRSHCSACLAPPAAGLRCSNPLGRLRPTVPVRGPRCVAGRPVGVGLRALAARPGLPANPLDTAPEVGQPAISPDREALPSAVR